MEFDYDSLADGGRGLWDSISGDHDLADVQLVQLLEACRAKDRLDTLNASMQSDEPAEWPQGALTGATNTANLMKQLLATLRLPESGQSRGGNPGTARLPYQKGGKKLSSLDRARAARNASA